MNRALHNVGLGGLLIGSVLLAACSGPKATTPVGAAAAVVERHTLAVQQVQDLRPVAGTYTAHDLVDARTRIAGTLTAVTVRAGDRVHRGQVLAVVRDQRFSLQAAAAQAQAVAAAAEVARAESELQRTGDLYANGVYAKARLEQVTATAQVARAQASAALAQQAAAAELATQGEVLAPAEGLVLQSPLPPGSVVTAGQIVAQVTAGAQVIRLQLPDAAVLQLQPGQPLRCRADDGSWTNCGPVLQVYPSTLGGQVQIDLAGGQARRFIGQSVEVLVPVAMRAAVQVPRRFVTTRYGVDTVQLLRADGSVAAVVVQLAAATGGDQVELLSGVRAGDTVVVLGTQP